MHTPHLTEIDYFAVYNPDTNRCFLISIDDAPKDGARLRIEKPLNNQSANIRWADDYEL